MTYLTQPSNFAK